MTYYEPPPYPKPDDKPAEPTWTDPGPPPWQTSIRVNRMARANVLRRRLARKRALLGLVARTRSALGAGVELALMLALLCAAVFLCAVGFLSYLWAPWDCNGGRWSDAKRAARSRR